MLYYEKYITHFSVLYQHSKELRKFVIVGADIFSTPFLVFALSTRFDIKRRFISCMLWQPNVCISVNELKKDMVGSSIFKHKDFREHAKKKMLPLVIF